jgi:hypothetical protein
MDVIQFLNEHLLSGTSDMPRSWAKSRPIETPGDLLDLEMRPEPLLDFPRGEWNVVEWKQSLPPANGIFETPGQIAAMGVGECQHILQMGIVLVQAKIV